MDFTKLSDAELQKLASDIYKEKQKRKRSDPNFHKTNLEKSLSKSYERYQNIYKPHKNTSWDYFKVTGWTFEQFKEFVLPRLGKMQLNKPIVLNFIPLFDIELAKCEEEWRKTNDSSYGKNGFCELCDRYYIGEECNGSH